VTSSSLFNKSIGSIFSTINKSVSSAFNNLITAPDASGGPHPVDPTSRTSSGPGAAGAHFSGVGFSGASQLHEPMHQDSMRSFSGPLPTVERMDQPMTSGGFHPSVGQAQYYDSHSLQGVPSRMIHSDSPKTYRPQPDYSQRSQSIL